MTDLGGLYGQSRRRVAELLGGADEAAWRAPVAACPGWTVHDVVGHLVGVAEDVLAGELSDIPGAVQTAAQAERHRADPPAGLLERWADVAGPFERLVTAARIWPAVLDVGSHEHDIRTALSAPGARDDELIVAGARQLVRTLDASATVTFDFDGEVVHSRPRAGPGYLVRTTPFEAFRLRLGRRSRSQVAALEWTPDPGDLVDELFTFGPRDTPLAE